RGSQGTAAELPAGELVAELVECLAAVLKAQAQRVLALDPGDVIHDLPDGIGDDIRTISAQVTDAGVNAWRRSHAQAIGNSVTRSAIEGHGRNTPGRRIAAGQAGYADLVHHVVGI